MKRIVNSQIVVRVGKLSELENYRVSKLLESENYKSLLVIRVSEPSKSAHYQENDRSGRIIQTGKLL